MVCYLLLFVSYCYIAATVAAACYCCVLRMSYQHAHEAATVPKTFTVSAPCAAPETIPETAPALADEIVPIPVPEDAHHTVPQTTFHHYLALEIVHFTIHIPKPLPLQFPLSL